MIGPGGFGTLGRDKLMLLAQKSVQDELKITEKQRRQVDQRLKKQREGFEALAQLPPEDAQCRLSKQANTNDGALSKLLTGEQFKRLKQISLQQRGAAALADQDVAKSLALTGSQKKQIQQIQDDAREEMATALQGLAPPGGFGGPGADPAQVGRRVADGRAGCQDPVHKGRVDKCLAAQQPNPQGNAPNNADRPNGPPGGAGPGGPPTEEQRQAMRDSFKKLDALRASTNEKLLAVLNSDQQAKWQDMQGEPFQGELRGPGPGGRRPDGDAPPDGNAPPPERQEPGN